MELEKGAIYRVNVSGVITLKNTLAEWCGDYFKIKWRGHKAIIAKELCEVIRKTRKKSLEAE